MAQEGDDRIRTVTFFTTQVDFTYAGDLKVFVDEDQVAAVERSMNEKGYLEGTKMATAFNMLRSGDLIWPYVVNNYMRGKDPTAVRPALLERRFRPAWGRPTTPSTCATAISRTTSRTAAWNSPAAPFSLGDIKIPVYNLASREDHIAPSRSVFLGSQYFGGPVEYVMAGSGHIAGVVNPPAVEEVPVLDRRQAGRRFRGLDRAGHGKSRVPGGRTGKSGSRTRTTPVSRPASQARRRRCSATRRATM